MGFHEIRFPASLSFGSIGGPERRTEVVALVNGHEERNSPWAQSRRRYDAGLALRSLEDIETLIAFFEARRGQLHGFRWKDWTDYKSCRAGAEPGFGDQILGLGDGRRTVFQLIKTYRSGDQSEQRVIAKPVAGSLRVGVEQDPLREGVDFQVDITSGVLTLDQPPALGQQVSAGFEFDVPVRFDTDRIQTSLASFQAGEMPQVPVVEIRL